MTMHLENKNVIYLFIVNASKGKSLWKLNFAKGENFSNHLQTFFKKLGK